MQRNTSCAPISCLSSADTWRLCCSSRSRMPSSTARKASAPDLALLHSATP